MVNVATRAEQWEEMATSRKILLIFLLYLHRRRKSHVGPSDWTPHRLPMEMAVSLAQRVATNFNARCYRSKRVPNARVGLLVASVNRASFAVAGLQLTCA